MGLQCCLQPETCATEEYLHSHARAPTLLHSWIIHCKGS